MNLKRINSSAIAILVVGLAVLAVGTSSDNSGFQLAGVLFLVVGGLLAFRQLSERDQSSE